MRKPARVLLVLTFTVSFAVQPVSAQATSAPPVDVLAVQSTANHQVSMVAALSPLPSVPLSSAEVSGSSGGAKLPVKVQPILSDRAGVALIVDASAAGTRSVQGGGLSGAASFLLQVPPGAAAAVIADRQPPSIVAASSSGAAEDLQAVSSMRSSGARATSAALTLALHQLRPWPGTQPIIVLYTGGSNAGGEPASALAARLRTAHAVLAVVSTNSNLQYWSQVATSTGGLAVATQAAQAITVFDNLADALRARYQLTFPRPPSGRVSLRFDVGGKRSVVGLGLPANQVTPTASSGRGSSGTTRTTPASTGLTGRPVFWLVGLGELAAAIAAIVIIVRGFRRRGERAKPPPLEGVRIFDVTQPGGPREITGSLVQERTRWDAQERAARGGDDPAG
jgi:hypothetical protein